MTSDRVVVLDVRTQEEYDEKHIVNARLLTLDTIDAEAAAAGNVQFFAHFDSRIASR